MLSSYSPSQWQQMATRWPPDVVQADTAQRHMLTGAAEWAEASFKQCIHAGDVTHKENEPARNNRKTRSHHITSKIRYCITAVRHFSLLLNGVLPANLHPNNDIYGRRLCLPDVVRHHEFAAVPPSSPSHPRPKTEA